MVAETKTFQLFFIAFPAFLREFHPHDKQTALPDSCSSSPSRTCTIGRWIQPPAEPRAQAQERSNVGRRCLEHGMKYALVNAVLLFISTHI
jgi:hypothetical protein